MGGFTYNCSNGTDVQSGIGPQSTTQAPFVTGGDGNGALVIPPGGMTGFVSDLSTEPVVPNSSTAFTTSVKGISSEAGQLDATLFDANFNVLASGTQDVTVTTAWTSFDLGGASYAWSTGGSAATVASYTATHPAAYVIFDFLVGDYNCDGGHTLSTVAFDDAAFAGQTFNEKINWEPTPNDPTQPTILSTTPSNGAVLTGPFAISATPSSPPSGINAVEFTIDGQTSNPFTDYAPPFGFSLSSMSPGSHSIVVKAQNGAGVWGPTTSVSFTYAGPAAPAAPGAPTAVPGAQSAQLSWTAPASDGGGAITGYAIESSSNGGATWSAPTMTGSAATSYTVSGLAGATSYVFRVAAVNSAGTGAFSAASAAVVTTGPSAACTAAKSASATAAAQVSTDHVAIAKLKKALKVAKRKHANAAVKKLAKKIKAANTKLGRDTSAALAAANAVTSSC